MLLHSTARAPAANGRNGSAGTRRGSTWHVPVHAGWIQSHPTPSAPFTPRFHAQPRHPEGSRIMRRACVPALLLGWCRQPTFCVAFRIARPTHAVPSVQRLYAVHDPPTIPPPSGWTDVLVRQTTACPQAATYTLICQCAGNTQNPPSRSLPALSTVLGGIAPQCSKPEPPPTQGSVGLASRAGRRIRPARYRHDTNCGTSRHSSNLSGVEAIRCPCASARPAGTADTGAPLQRLTRSTHTSDASPFGGAVRP